MIVKKRGMIVKKTIVVLATICLCLPINARIQDAITAEYKAIYIHRILQSTRWPDKKKEHINLCIIGEKKNYPFFEAITDDSLNKHYIPIKLTYNITSNNLKNCDSVFVPYEQKEKGIKFLKIAKNLPILTIGEKDMGWHCAMISLNKLRGHIRFTFNQRVYERSKLRIDTKVLEVGYMIYEDCN
jgi:hypothetical protein